MSRGALPFKVLQGAFADKLPRAKRFRAWKQAGGRPAILLDIGDAATLDAALLAALAGPVIHKDTVIIHEWNAATRQGTLHTWRIRESARVYRRDPVTGLSAPMKPLKPDHLFSLPVDEFAPTRPFDALRDDATGFDRALIEGAAK